MTVKEQFKRGLAAIKGGAYGAVVCTMMMGAAIPVGGVLAHGARSLLSDDYLHNNYSLKHRFETAYSFDTPEAHKYYTCTPTINGYSQETEQQRYLASPYATYGTMAFAGLAGAVLGGGAALAATKRRQR